MFQTHFGKKNVPKLQITGSENSIQIFSNMIMYLYSFVFKDEEEEEEGEEGKEEEDNVPTYGKGPMVTYQYYGIDGWVVG